MGVVSSRLEGFFGKILGFRMCWGGGGLSH